MFPVGHRSASAPFHCFGHFNLAPAMFALAEELPEATDDSILWWPGHLSPVLMSALNRSLWSRLVRSASAPFHCFGHFNLAPAMFALAEEIAGGHG